MSFPKKGKEFPERVCATRLAAHVAAALRRDLGQTHAAVKTISGWTGAHERTVKQWLSGRICPRGDHLIRLASQSDEVLGVILRSANRPDVELRRKFDQVHGLLVELLSLVERSRETWGNWDDEDLPEHPKLKSGAYA